MKTFKSIDEFLGAFRELRRSWDKMNNYQHETVKKLWQDIKVEDRYAFLEGFLACAMAGEEADKELPVTIKGDLFLVQDMNFNVTRNDYELKQLFEVIALKRTIGRETTLVDIPELWKKLFGNEKEVYINLVESIAKEINAG